MMIDYARCDGTLPDTSFCSLRHACRRYLATEGNTWLKRPKVIDGHCHDFRGDTELVQRMAEDMGQC